MALKKNDDGTYSGGLDDLVEVSASANKVTIKFLAGGSAVWLPVESLDRFIKKLETARYAATLLEGTNHG